MRLAISYFGEASATAFTAEQRNPAFSLQPNQEWRKKHKEKGSCDCKAYQNDKAVN